MDTALTKTDSDFRFDPETHTYWLGDRWLPNISWILEEMGYKKSNPMAREEHLYRGNYVHWAIRLLNEKDLDWGDLDPAYSGYVQAYAKLTTDFNIVPLYVEKPRYHPDLFFAGTADIVTEDTIWEIKTGQVFPWVALQTAGQELLERAWDPKKRRRQRRAVTLNADGTYLKPVIFKEWARDETAFRTMMGAINNRVIYGIKIQKEADYAAIPG